MTSPNRSKFSSVAGLAMLASLPATSSAQAQGAPTDVVDRGQLGTVIRREAGDRDPNGPEFVVRFSTMHRGDITYNEGGLSGRAIDCDDMVAGPDGNGELEWKLTARFLARSFDLADGSQFDKLYDQEKGAVVGATFMRSMISHIDFSHHPEQEVFAVAGYCNTRYPPSNG